MFDSPSRIYAILKLNQEVVRMYTGYYIDNNYINGPLYGGQFYILDNFIYGPRVSGKYRIDSAFHIYGPSGRTGFYILGIYIYGPSLKLPWFA